MNKNQDLVSIIIVNYNGREYLEKCLKSLDKIDYENFEIILVDNNSTDNSIKFVKNTYPSIMIIKLDKNYGFAEPNNIGAKNAKGKFLLFLNNDTIVTPNFITAMVQVINQDPKIIICQSRLLKPDGTVDSSGDYIDTLGRAFSLKEENLENRRIFSARGASMLVNKEKFFELGEFDKNFFASFEDVDLGWRANIFGYKVFLASQSIVYHTGGQTIKKINSELQFHGVKNTLLLRLINFEFSFALKSIITLFFVTIMRKFFGISVIKDPEKSPNLPSFKIIIKGIIWVLKNLNYVLMRQKRIKLNRKNSTKDLIKIGLIKRKF